MTDRVTISIDDRGVADVRLNRPDKRNALDGAMFAGAARRRRAAEVARPRVRAVVLSGEGASFCAGLDFSSFQPMAGGDGRPAPPTATPARMTPGGITHLGQQVAGCGRSCRCR